MSVRFPSPVFALAILAPGLAIGSIHAATASASFSVSATVQASCVAAVTTTAIRNSTATEDAASAVAVDCSNSGSYSVSLDSEVVQDDAAALRPMTCPGIALLGNALGSNVRGIVNGHQARNYDLTEFGNSSPLDLAIRDRFSARCVMPGTHPNTMIVVVTY